MYDDFVSGGHEGMISKRKMSRFKSAWAITSLIVLNSHPSLAQVRQHSLLNKPSHDVISFGNDQIIDAKLSYFVRDDILARRGVKGMALTIIKPNNEVEYGTWGVRSEKNDEVIPDVRPIPIIWLTDNGSNIHA
jgi:hypothetical protein